MSVLHLPPHIVVGKGPGNKVDVWEADTCEEAREMMDEARKAGQLAAIYTLRETGIPLGGRSR